MSRLSTSPFVLLKNGHLVYKYPSEDLKNTLNKYLPLSSKIELNSSPYYPITIISPDDILTTPGVSEETVQAFLTETLQQHNSEEFKLIDLGFGTELENVFTSKTTNDINYIFVHYPFGDKIRENFKLNPIDFYVELSQELEFKYIHRSLKDPSVMCTNENPTDFIIENPSPILSKQIELLEWTLKEFPKTAKLVLELYECYTKTDGNNARALQLSDMLLDLNELAGFYFKIKTLQAMGESASNILQRISNSLSKFKITKPTDSEQKTYIDFILKFLNEKTNEGQWKYYFYEVDVLTQKFVRSQLPSNFGWVRQNVTAGSSLPDSADLNIFEKMGIKHVISCFEEPVFSKNYSSILQVHFFEIRDYTAPTLKQMDQMLAIIAKGEPTLVHCLGGAGRTNTVLVCDLIQTENLNSEQAIAKIKQLRPIVILEDCQVKLIRKFSERHFNKLS